MAKRILIVAGLVAMAAASSGCVPLALGAGGAVAADEVSENRGGNLF